MPKWEYLYLQGLGQELRVAPSGRINYNTLALQPKEVSYYKYWDADDLSYPNDEASKAKHLLMDMLCNEGWEPFAVNEDFIYLKRIRQE